LNKDWHRQDILAAVRKVKGSLSALSRENGLSASTLSNTLIRPWPKGEIIIAEAIGLSPQEIWPSRFIDERGNAKIRNTIRKNRAFKRKYNEKQSL
jgi:Ner family transcriptional regulator